MLAQKAAQAAISAETAAESTAVRLGTIMALRKLLKQRSDLVQVTVNDLLVLYRGLHAVIYAPSARLQQALDELGGDRRPDVQRALGIVRDELERLHGKNPAILIPLDASGHDPRERVFPTTFRNPLTDFYDWHVHTLDTLQAYKSAPRGSRT
jgi:hypothetical protein